MHDDKDSLITRTIGIYGSNSYAQSLQYQYIINNTPNTWSYIMNMVKSSPFFIQILL